MGDKLNMLLFLGKMLSFLFAKAPDSQPTSSNSWPAWGTILARLNFRRDRSSGGSMPTAQGIWVDLTENRQMVLESYGAKNKDELETLSSPKERIVIKISMIHGRRCGAHHLKHHWTELSYHGEKGSTIMGQNTGFCLYLRESG